MRRRLSYDKLSQPAYQKSWGKYRLALDGYVYDVNGKMILIVEDDSMISRMLRWRSVKFDQYVENYMKHG